MHRISFILLLLIISCSSPTGSGTACEGTVDCEGTCNGTATEDCAGTCEGTATDGGCGCAAPLVADLTTGCDFPSSQTTAYLKLLDNGKLLYRSPYDIGGYQFVVDGAVAGNTVTISGGDAETAGLSTQSLFNDTDGYLAVSFSMTGAYIAAGCGILTELATSDFTLTTISAPVLSTTSATNIPTEIYCTD